MIAQHDCEPDATGRYCFHCGWIWTGYPRPWPRRHCHVLKSPADRARMTAALLAAIDTAIAASEIAPWSQLGRDRQTVEALLRHCASCEELSAAGCERVPWPCKRWSLWRQTVLVGWCERWGERE